MSHTFATLELSPAAYNEIREKLKAAGYDHAFHDDGHLDLHGLAANTEHEAGCYSKPYPEGRSGPCACRVTMGATRSLLPPVITEAAAALEATESAAAAVAEIKACDDCAPEFSCFNGSNPCAKKPRETQLERLARFKTYVHERLDRMNVPADPEPQANAAHGCRIEGRLNWLLDQMIAAEDKAETLEAKLHVPPELFVLKKRGAWWRPKACGYAEGILYAGTYTRAEAESYANGSSGEVTMFPLEEAIADALGPWGAIDRNTLCAAFAHNEKRGGQ